MSKTDTLGKNLTLAMPIYQRQRLYQQKNSVTAPVIKYIMYMEYHMDKEYILAGW